MDSKREKLIEELANIIYYHNGSLKLSSCKNVVSTVMDKIESDPSVLSNEAKARIVEELRDKKLIYWPCSEVCYRESDGVKWMDLALTRSAQRLRDEEMTPAFTCPHCKDDIRIANPTGDCNHVYYPNNLCEGCDKLRAAAQKLREKTEG